MKQIELNANFGSRAAELRERVEGISAENHPNFDLIEYQALLLQGGDIGYGALSLEAIAAEKFICSLNTEFCLLVNKYLAALLLDSFNLQGGGYSLPSTIVKLYDRELQRIQTQLDKLDLNFYRLSNDSFVKDLAILTHRLIPVGAEYACPSSGVPRSLLFKRGIAQFFKVVNTCVLEGGGFSPYFELHTHTAALDDFNQQGWIQTYVRLAELLEYNSSVKGVFSSSWFLDPALVKVSPHLNYLRLQSEETGAVLLFSCYDKEGISGVLEKSQTRRKLFQQGVYIPAIYSRIWTRDKLILWKNLKA